MPEAQAQTTVPASPPRTETMRYVVTLSGGEGSWGSGRYLIDSLGVSPEQVTLLFTDTNGEDADLYRFLRECADDLGSELVWIDNDGQTIWDAWFISSFALDRTALTVTHADPCALARAVEQVGAAVEVNRKRESRDLMREAIARGMERRGPL